MALDGINRLIMVTQMKAHNANEDAMDGADRQRDLINKQRNLRDVQRKFEEFARDKKFDANDQSRTQGMFNGLAENGVDVGPYNYTFQGDGSTGSVDDGAQKQNADNVEGIRKALEAAMKDLEAQDRLGNFEIQDLMSQYNQAETLASSVLKKRDDTGSAVIGKVG